MSDMRRCDIERQLDVSEATGLGFIEVTLERYKTAKPGTKAGMPVAMPICGVGDGGWAQAWLKRRQELALDASIGFGLFAAPLAGGHWSTLSLSTAEVGKGLRKLLSDEGFGDELVADIGSHSLKATTLSWVAKKGPPPRMSGGSSDTTGSPGTGVSRPTPATSWRAPSACAKRCSRKSREEVLFPTQVVRVMSRPLRGH